MFTLYGNQYDQREELLLLTMFQVRLTPPSTFKLPLIFYFAVGIDIPIRPHY